MNRLDVRDRAQVLQALCEGNSLRACERIFKRPLGTVVRIVEEVGDMAIDFHRSLPPVRSERIQADELWSFVGQNDRGVAKPDKSKAHDGVTWTYLAIDRDTNLVLAYHNGSRRTVDATKFMKKLADRLERSSNGEFVVKPTISVDGLKAYRDAIEQAFADTVHAGSYEKTYDRLNQDGEPTPGSRFVGALRKPIKGSPAYEDINTWRVERENGFMRQANRRFTRKTNAFSKSMIFHERQVAIWMLYRNFCWVPRPRRPRDGSDRWVKRVTPAMEAGLTDRIWTEDDLIELADRFLENRASNSVKKPEKSENAPENAPFWVNHSPQHRRAKIHSAECSARRKALGSTPRTNYAGAWTGFSDRDEAIAFGAKLEPVNHEECRLCLGSYKMLSTYGRRI